MLRQRPLRSTLWSALTSQRFGLRRPDAGVRTWIQANHGRDQTQPAAAHRTPNKCALILMIAALGSACAANQERRSLPPEVESAIGTINEEIAAERYDKIYNEASELWRQDATLEESTTTFKTLRSKLGAVENRTLQAATEQQNSGGPLKGRTYIVSYRTKFHNGEGMETFTLVERDGRWLLARYFVNSMALK